MIHKQGIMALYHINDKKNLLLKCFLRGSLTANLCSTPMKFEALRTNSNLACPENRRIPAQVKNTAHYNMYFKMW